MASFDKFSITLTDKLQRRLTALKKACHVSKRIDEIETKNNLNQCLVEFVFSRVTQSRLPLIIVMMMIIVKKTFLMNET